MNRASVDAVATLVNPVRIGSVERAGAVDAELAAKLLNAVAVPRQQIS